MRVIFADPNFKGMNGQFDPARFQAIIRQFGYSEARYLADQKKVSLRRQLAGTINAGLSPVEHVDGCAEPLPERAALGRICPARSARRPAPSIRPRPKRSPPISTSTRRSSARPNTARSPSSRSRRKKSANGPTSPTRTPRRCSSSARTSSARPRSVRSRRSCSRHVEEAQAARGRIASGTSFEDIAKERKLDTADVDLGLVAKSGILDPAIADAAFALPTGEVSQPVQGKFGVALVKVGVIQPGDRAGLCKRRERHQEGDRGRARAQPGRHLARQDGGRARRRRQRGRGRAEARACPRHHRCRRSLRQDAGRPARRQYSAGPRRHLAGLQQRCRCRQRPDLLSSGGYVWYDVLGITPPRDRTLDEVKDQVEARWKDDQIASRLRTKATEMVQKLDARRQSSPRKRQAWA